MLFNPLLLLGYCLSFFVVLSAVVMLVNRHLMSNPPNRFGPVIYALSIGMYCSAWSLYGGIAGAAQSGWGFLPIFIAPIIVLMFGYNLLRRIVTLCKRHRITSVADFIAFRFGRSRLLSVSVTMIATFGSLPFMALQLKAISESFQQLSAPLQHSSSHFQTPVGLVLCVAMAVFISVFGTRLVDSNERQSSLIWVVAGLSAVKLIALLAVAFYSGLLLQSADNIQLQEILTTQFSSANLGITVFSWGFWLNCLISMLAFISLPRQFHVLFVEHRKPDYLPTARWLVSFYMLLFIIGIVPIAIGGKLLLSPETIGPLTYAIALPQSYDNAWLSLLIFTGGLAAAFAMILVCCIALTTMLCNEVLIPVIVSRYHSRIDNISRRVIHMRKLVVYLLLVTTYLYYLSISSTDTLFGLGYLTFAAMCNLAPALLFGVYTARISRQAIIAGIIGGLIAWLVLLVAPAFIGSFSANDLVSSNLLIWLSSANDIELANRVVMTLAINIMIMLLFSIPAQGKQRQFSQTSIPPDNEALVFRESSNQLNDRVQIRHTLESVTARFIGKDETATAYRTYFGDLALQGPDKISVSDLVQFTEQLLSGVIGTSSVHSLLTNTLKPHGIDEKRLQLLLSHGSPAMRFNRRLLEATLENITQGVSVLNENQQLIGWNRRYLEIMQYPQNYPYLGQPIRELIEHNIKRGFLGTRPSQEIIDHFMFLITNNSVYQTQVDLPDDRIIEIYGSPMPGGGYIHTFTDVTDYKNTEKALIESEANVRLYTDNTPLMLVYIDLQQITRFVNLTASRFFELTHRQALNKPISELLPAEQYDRFLPHLRIGYSGRRSSYITELSDKRGLPRYYRNTVMPDNDEDGRVRGVFITGQDVTRQHKAEMALEEANRNLEQRVNHRTTELQQSNIKLDRARRIAEKANASKTHFLAGASHDLMQPMNAARLYVSVMQQNRADINPKMQELVNNIDASLDAAESLLTTLLDISKLDSGYVQPVPEAFSVKNLWRRLEAQFSSVCEDKGIELRVKYCDAGVRSDPRLLHRVMQNLVGNAVRYTQRGGILLTCRSCDDEYRLCVYDTGIGIADSELEAIFGEFYRLNPAKQIDDRGLGLGLSISQRMVDVLGHDMGVRSVQGRGSCFWVSVKKAVPSKDKKAETIDRTPLDALRGKCCLCIDNDQNILQGMQALLEGWNCEVLLASDHIEALRIAEAHKGIDIVLADYHLCDEINGLQLIEQLRSGPLLNIPAVIISADRTVELEVNAKQASVGLLRKPIKPAALRSLLTRQIRLRC